MEKIKVAFYSDTYLPAVDGVVTSMLNFKKGLEKKGHEVYIFASGDATSKRRYLNSHVFIMPGISFKPYPQYKLAFFPYHTIIKLQKEKIDILHAQTPFFMGFTALTIGRFIKLPVVGTFHTFINNKKVLEEYYPKNKFLKKFTSKYLWKYTTFFYRKCNVTIVPTKTVKNILGKHKVTNTEIVPNSVDTEKFNPNVDGEQVREKLKLKQNVVLYVGRISKEKRIEVMLKAAKVLSKKRSDVSYVIVGRGPAMDHYKLLAQKLGVSNIVKFVGFVEDGDLPKYYAASDMLCMPSTFETQGIVALEAMACGKPVVGTDYLALKEVIKDGKTGEKFKPGDYISCARKIEKVLNNSDIYKRNTVALANEFSIPKATDRLLDVYNKVLEKAIS
ncbi:MAG: glycosyltransferase [Candidatus Micrarchaeia archaeon]|jgi:1,2-diacylglycerol 3-alpha-glucosyltransferase